MRRYRANYPFVSDDLFLSSHHGNSTIEKHLARIAGECRKTEAALLRYSMTPHNDAVYGITIP